MKVQTHTFVRGGLPVKARGRFIAGSRSYEGPSAILPAEPDLVEDIEVFFPSGHPFSGPICDQDMNRIEDELIKEAKDEGN